MAVSKPRKHLFTPDKTAVVVSKKLLFCRKKAMPFSFRGCNSRVTWGARPALPRPGLPFLAASQVQLATTLQPHPLLTHFTSPSCSILIFKLPGKMLQPRGVWVAAELCTALGYQKNPKLGIPCFDRNAGSVPLIESKCFSKYKPG